MRFTISGGGSVADTLVRTDDKGRASCGRWTLGLTPGDNGLVATAENAASSVYFLAHGRVVLGVVRESYKLYSIGGVPLPVPYSIFGGSWVGPPAAIVGGEYLLADDGTFAWGLDVLSAGITRSSLSTGVYTRSDSTIRFALDGGWPLTGTVHGDTLRVEDTDFTEPDIYIRVPAPPSANRAAAASMKPHQ